VKIRRQLLELYLRSEFCPIIISPLFRTLSLSFAPLMLKVMWYDRFKDHKRCSYMIANALDGDRVFTPAQISRKLKQLGLRVPQQKKAEATLHLRDENPSDHSADEMQDSDNETLLSLRLR